MRPLRRDIQMIFQDPYSSLNPRHTVGTIVGAPFRHPGRRARGRRQARRCRSCSSWSGLNPEHYNRYPHEFSGGQRQRIGIARTLALKPKLIVADEPVSALDVSIQAQVVNLLEDLQEELDLTYVIIAHDLSVVRHVSDRVAVMYLGKIVEIGRPRRPLRPPAAPLHGRAALRGPGARHRRAATRPRSGSCCIGDVPSPINPPSGCRFHTRCWKAQDICGTEEPPLLQITSGPAATTAGHTVACHFPVEPGEFAAKG